jgi:tetratricopeptide (TPR) repeat protein
MQRSHRAVVASLLLLLAVATYWPVQNHDFVNYDDDDYITENATVQQGLSASTLRWAWTSTEAANWHPLTWTSHLIDVSLFELNPGPHHMTNVALHGLSTVLLFFALGALGRPNGGWRRSAVVAALFAVHRAHVQSVAWVAEHKDVLSGVFWMASLLAYAWYAARPGAGRYLVVFVSLALGLTAKPMLVTLPFVLLLLDVWPLKREEVWRRLVMEKLPLLALSVGSSIVTVVAQSGGQGFSSPQGYSLGVRAANALAAYAGYLGKLFAPVNLAVFYPHPGSDVPWLRVAVGATALATMSVLAWWQRRERPWLLVGWLWFAGTLVPVIGLLQVGGQAMADRYTYLPYIGLFVVLVWGGNELLGSRRAIAGATAAFVVVALALLARGEIAHWKNTETLFERALEVTGPNHVARINLAEHLGQQDRPEEALEQLQAALVDFPDSIKAHYNTGVALTVLGRHEEAVPYFERTVAAEPDHVEAHTYLGASKIRQRRYDEAYAHFERVVALAPGDAEAHFNMGIARAAQRRWDSAATHYRRALRLRPDYGRAHFELSQALFGAQQYSAALDELRLARRHGHDVPERMIEQLSAMVAQAAAPN